MAKAEVFWVHAHALAANPADGDALPSDVELPDGLADRLNAAHDAYCTLVDEIINHLRATGQTVPPIPACPTGEDSPS